MLLSQFIVYLKLTQHCKSTILQLKKKKARQSSLGASRMSFPNQCWSPQETASRSLGHRMPAFVTSGQFSYLLQSPWHLCFIISIWVLQFRFDPLLLIMFESTSILWPPDANSWLIWKDPDAEKDWRWQKGTTEDEMAGWHHWLDGHEFGWTLRVGDEQGGLACCCPQGHKESDTTERLNCTELNSTSSLRLHPALSKIKNIKLCIPQCLTDTRAHPELRFLHQVLSSGSLLWSPSNWQASTLIRLNF